jgi:hypothetical protein
MEIKKYTSVKDIRLLLYLGKKFISYEIKDKGVIIYKNE